MWHARRIPFCAMLMAPLAVEIFRYLSRRDLLALAFTCQMCRDGVAHAMVPKAQDISEGLETTPVRCRFALADLPGLLEPLLSLTDRACHCKLLDFVYTKHNRLPSSIAISTNSEVAGCNCEANSSSETLCRHCTCAVDDSSLLLEDISADVHKTVVECGPACTCGLQCPLRVTQQGVHVALVLQQSSKGMAVMAAQQIEQGQFVAQYAGEFLTNKEAEKRLAQYDSNRTGVGHALLVIREILPSGSACLRFNIDATHIGNVARFFNHSCDGGNLELEVVRSRGNPLPHVAMFASKDINAGEEVTFSYGPGAAYHPGKRHEYDATIKLASQRRPCFCNSANCLGFLPSS